MQEGSTRIAMGAADWRDRLIATAIPVSLFLFAFRGPLSGRIFYLRDISQNHEPMRRFVTERLLSGALPLWDPFHGGGTPLLANPNNLVLHPISALFLILPFNAAFTASILLQFALMACGGFLLARALPVGRPAATLAALILGFSGPAASMASLQNVLSAAAWIPIALWAWLRGLESGRRWPLAFAAAFAAVIVSTGEAGSIVAFLSLAAVLGFTRGDTSRGITDLRGVARGLGIVIGGALALAAAQLLPARELLGLSTRGAGFDISEGLKWSLEPVRLLELVLPGLFGDPTRLSPSAWWGRWRFEGGYPFLLSLYIGAIPCLLAASALFGRGAAALRRRALGVSGAVFLLAALGGHGLVYRTLFAGLPWVREIRYPERFALSALFVIALLAAIGLDRFLAMQRRSRVMIGSLVGLGGVVFLIVSAVASSPAPGDFFLSRGAGVPDAVLETGAGSVMRGSLLHSLLWMFIEISLLTACGFVAGANRRLTGFAGWGLVAAAGVSMTIAAAPALSTADPGWLEAPSPLRSVVSSGIAAPRVHHDIRPENLAVWTRTDEVIWGYRFDRFTYALASGHVDGVPTVLNGATDRMDLGAPAILGRRLQRLPIADRIRILSIAHAGFLLTYDRVEHPLLEAGPVLEGLSRPALRVYRLRSELPRARFVDASKRPIDPADSLRSLLDPGFDPQRMVLLDEPAAPAGGGIPGTAVARSSEFDEWGDGVMPAEAAGPALVTILEDEPERIRVQVSAPRDGYLFLADTDAPGWKAEVDDRSTPILRANGLFRAVPVRAGTALVEMIYRPASVSIGMIISLMTMATGIGWCLRRRGGAS